MEAQRLILHAVRCNDHRGQYVDRFQHGSPRRDQLAVTGEHDGLGRSRRDIRRDRPPTAVSQPLGDELTRDGRHPTGLPVSSGRGHRRRG
jgi:hypothetical protein